MGGMQFNMQAECDTCGGRGKSIDVICPGCRGRKVVGENKNL